MKKITDIVTVGGPLVAKAIADPEVLKPLVPWRSGTEVAETHRSGIAAGQAVAVVAIEQAAQVLQVREQRKSLELLCHAEGERLQATGSVAIGRSRERVELLRMVVDAGDPSAIQEVLAFLREHQREDAQVVLAVSGRTQP